MKPSYRQYVRFSLGIGALLVLLPSASVEASIILAPVSSATANFSNTSSTKLSSNPGLVASEQFINHIPGLGNSITWRQFALEFDVGAVPATIESALLSVSETVSASPSVTLWYYQGTGSVTVPSFAAKRTVFSQFTANSHGIKTVTYELSSALQAAKASGWNYLGIGASVSGSTEFILDVGILQWQGNGTIPAPQLTITVPEPSTLVLGLLAVAAFLTWKASRAVVERWRALAKSPPLLDIKSVRFTNSPRG